MSPIRIQRQDYKTRGTYVATVPGVHGIARLNYKHERPGSSLPNTPSGRTR
jgi:hypothetical protein